MDEKELNTSSAAGVSRAGLILTGGGARAAYQVGVLKALSQICPQRKWPFPIIVGTSAGAVSASILAANVTRWHKSIQEIEAVWANFRVNHVFRSDAIAMLKAGGRWMGSLFTGGAIGPPKSLLDNSPLRELLSQVTDFDAVRINVAHGHLRALALCATSYFTARSVSFFEADTTIGEWSRAQRHGERVPLSLDYLMASLGIPFLFPPMCLHGEYFGDGAMRQTAPLSPAIHLGADRLLVLGVRPTHLDLIPRFVASDTPPSPGQLFGYMLDTLFSDQISADLEHLNRINRLSALAGGGMGTRQIQTMLIAPSVDPSELAIRHVDNLPMSLRALMRIIGARGASGGLLASYLMFDADYTRELIELGFSDTLGKRDELAAFLA
jgi:NTE family protein